VFTTFFKHTVMTLFISSNSLTTLYLPSKVEHVSYGGSQDDIFQETYGKGYNRVAIKSKVKKINTNMVIETEHYTYSFDIIQKDENPHKNVWPKPAKKSSGFKEVFSNKKVTIHQGENSALVVNNTGRPLNINGTMVQHNVEIGLRIPVFVNKKLVFNEWRVEL